MKALTVRVSVAAIVAALTTSSPAAAADLADIFGARDSVQQISMSPDGAKIAYIAPKGSRGSALYVANLAGGMPQQIAALDGNPQRLLNCHWVANDRLACVVYMIVQADEIVPLSRLIAIDADGKNVKVLSQQDALNLRYSNLYGGTLLDFDPGEEGSVLIDRWFVPEEESHTPTRLAKKLEGYGVVKVN